MEIRPTKLRNGNNSCAQSLIALLQEMQQRYNYLPEEILREIARNYNLSLMDIYSVAKFYNSFSLRPRGRHKIVICSGTACHVHGSEKVLEALSRSLNLKPGDTTAGENVCGMDTSTILQNGKVTDTTDLDRRVKIYQQWQRDGYGAIVVQANVEDTRLGVQEYAISRLGVEVVELKWGQGAKDIGGEVKIRDLSKAQLLKQRGYIVLPDPENRSVIAAFRQGAFKEFERHSRIGMVELEPFLQRVEELRRAGAKYIFLKTGAYRPADLARAVKYASLARLDLLTVDGAGGGTGMSPWRMMNEWGIPSVKLHSLLYRYANKLVQKGEYVPDLALAGGFTLEDQIYKGLALGSPYVKLIGMARSPLAAAMVGKTIGRRIAEKQVPVYVERFGTSIEDVFVTAANLKDELGEETFRLVTPGALGVYTYFERLAQGLRQLMCGNRKFSLEYIARDDIAALTKEAAEISGIDHVMEVDMEKAERILDL